MQAFKIIISYDGTGFAGWQVQPHAVSISSCMQDIFFKVFGEKISLQGASRTDSGVHALGQVAKFNTALDLDAQRILLAWNNCLPKSIFIRQIEKVGSDFHPHVGVVQKIYCYHLFLKQPLPFVARYGWFFKFINKVDMPKFDNALQLYVGEHDFASFCKIESGEKRKTVRTIDSINLNHFSRFGMLQIVIKGKGFLRFQIRRMIGYALDIARQDNLSLRDLKKILDNPNPQQTFLKADGSGLCLKKVIYKK